MLFIPSIAVMVLAGIFIALVAYIYFAPVQATHAALAMTRWQSGLKYNQVTLTDGTRFAYLEGGQGNPLILLHGFGGNKDTFTRVARFLVKHARVIIPDIAGFGDTQSVGDSDYSTAQQVERIREFAHALEIKLFHLGGNSMGGQIALLYAATYPSEVQSLWLISPSGIWSAPDSPVFQQYKKSGQNVLVARNIKEFKQVMRLGMNKPPYVPAPMLMVLAQERIRNVELEQRIFAQLVDHSVEQEIKNLNTPSLIVFGENDRVISLKTAEILQKLLVNSKVIFVSKAGHVAMFERPKQCAKDYIAFRDSMVRN